MSADNRAEHPASKDDKAVEYADRTAVEQLGAWPVCQCPKHRLTTTTEDRLRGVAERLENPGPSRAHA